MCTDDVNVSQVKCLHSSLMERAYRICFRLGYKIVTVNVG